MDTLITNIIQTAAVLAAVGAAIIALVISAKDRQNSREIAAEDRREALRQAHLMFELDALSRLAVNMNRGGSTDKLERAQMGAEALTLTGLLGPERLPTQWEWRVGSEVKLREKMNDPETPKWQHNALETQLALHAVQAEIRAAIARG